MVASFSEVGDGFDGVPDLVSEFADVVHGDGGAVEEVELLFVVEVDLGSDPYEEGGVGLLPA